MWFLQKLRGKPEPFEAKSEPDNKHQQQQPPDSQLQSDQSVNDEKIVQVLDQNLENLVLSSDVVHEEEQVKRAIDEDHRHLVQKKIVDDAFRVEASSRSEEKDLEVNRKEYRVSEETVDDAFRAESSSGSGEKDRRDVKQFVDDGVERCRVEKVLEVNRKECRVSEERETGVRYENQEEKVYEHERIDLKGKHEIEVEDRDVSSKIEDYERKYEPVQDLENERGNIGGDGWEEGPVTVVYDGKLKDCDHPLRPDAEDCLYYMRTGMCKFGSNCKYNHPHRRNNQPIKETKKKKEENLVKPGPSVGKPANETKKKKEETLVKSGPSVGKPTRAKKKQKEENLEKHVPIECQQRTKETRKKNEENLESHGPTECKPSNETKKKKEENLDRHGPIESKPTKAKNKQKVDNLEKHGLIACKPAKETDKKKEENLEKHGSVVCKPSKETKKKKEENLGRHGPIESKPTKERQKQKEENLENQGPIECKHHTSSPSPGCKHEKVGKFNHGRGKTVKTPVVEYNFVGLPIRPGERECPYYMRNGSCKYGRDCRLNHPDPTAVGGSETLTTHGNDGSLSSQPTSQPYIPSMHSWSGPPTPERTTAFVPMMYPPTQNLPPPYPDWNVYQAPPPVPAHLYPSSEWGPPVPPTFFPNNPPSDTNMYTHYQQPMLVPEYPERPGQPVCTSFMKTGDCKYRASCKFHHPQSQSTSTSRVSARRRRPRRPAEEGSDGQQEKGQTGQTGPGL